MTILAIRSNTGLLKLTLVLILMAVGTQTKFEFGC